MQHKAAETLARPRLGASDFRVIDVVPRKCEARGVVAQIEQEQLSGGRRQKRQENARSGNRADVAKVGTRCDTNVLGGVGKRGPAFADALGNHAQVALEQHQVGDLLGFGRRRVHHDTDVCRRERGHVVHAVTNIADRVAGKTN